MTLAPPATITGAPRVALPFGLFSVFALRPSAGRWEDGVQWELGTCDPVDGIGDVECGQPEIISLTISGNPQSGTWTVTSGSPPATSDPLAIDADGGDVQAALNEIIPGGVLVGGEAGGPYTVVWVSNGEQPEVETADSFDTGFVTVASVQIGDNDPGPRIGLPKDLARNPGGTATATPFTVYGHFSCSPIGYTPEAAQAQATAHLQAREEQRVEQAFWARDLGNLPGLVGMGGTVLTVNPGGDELALGIAALEQFIATSYGNLGVIHMTRRAASIGLGRDLLLSSGARLTTRLGTPVAAGGGYPGTGPGGEVPAAGTTYLYVTPALFGYRSEVFTSSNRVGDLFDYGTNDLTAVAERTYLLGYDPCGVAVVLVKLPDPSTPAELPQ